jgi:hypothetical protein
MAMTMAEHTLTQLPVRLVLRVNSGDVAECISVSLSGVAFPDVATRIISCRLAGVPSLTLGCTVLCQAAERRRD